MLSLIVPLSGRVSTTVLTTLPTAAAVTVPEYEYVVDSPAPKLTCQVMVFPLRTPPLAVTLAASAVNPVGRVSTSGPVNVLPPLLVTFTE